MLVYMAGREKRGNKADIHKSEVAEVADHLQQTEAAVADGLGALVERGYIQVNKQGTYTLTASGRAQAIQW